jgi:MarR family transcriptional regulator, temperature-dependent positive regulator of motility
MRARIGDPDLVTNLPIVVLTELYLNGARRPVELQRVTGLTSGGMTKLLDRLESAGLITRSHGHVPTDRRAIEVDLTARGRTTAETIATVIIENGQEVAATFRRLADDAARMSSDPKHAGARSQRTIEEQRH